MNDRRSCRERGWNDGTAGKVELFAPPLQKVRRVELLELDSADIAPGSYLPVSESDKGHGCALPAQALQSHCETCWMTPWSVTNGSHWTNHFQTSDYKVRLDRR